MTEDFNNKFDLSIPRRKYYSEDSGSSNCPECRRALIEDMCTILITAKSDKDEGEFMSNMSGSRFCESCPVVVFDTDKVEQAVSLVIKGDNNIRYGVAGIINFNAIPQEKRHLEIGSDDNPVPLVPFLPKLIKNKIPRKKNISRNAPCPCDSGRKYKNCCGS